MGDVVISVEHLFKEYRLGVLNYGTLRQDLQSWWARMRGEDDPNALVSAHHAAADVMGHILALNDVSFDVRQGEVVGIIGRNGAGKSTLLKILSRVTAPSKGLVKLRGRVGSLLEVGTGFHPELTGRENIYLNGAILGMTRREIAKKFDEIVDFAELGRFIDTPVKRYSSGMYVRLAFAVAAHLEPEILLVDEVLAVGDAQFQKKCLGKMGEVAKGGRTVLFVSHNMGAVKNLCPHAVLIRNGEIACIGRSEECIRQYLNEGRETASSHPRYRSPERKTHPYITTAAITTLRGRDDVFSCEDDIVLDVCFEDFGLKNLAVGLAVKNDEGVYIHHSSDEYTQSLRSKNSRRCTIPAQSLLPGKYFIDLFLMVRNIELYDSVIDTLDVTLGGDSLEAVQLSANMWKGVSSPKLIKWE